jgi:hypothetical protein
MPRALRFPGVWPLVVALMTPLSQSASTAYGHERREVGPYRFIVGFLAEPAFEGLKNGVDLRVLQAATDAPVEGLQETLQVEVTHVSSAVGKVLKLRTIYRDPGHYTADLIPTAPGQYRFRFFGSIQALTVQETFDSKSGGGQFDDIESSGDIQFPVRLPEIREIANAVRGTQQTTRQAQDAALAAQAGLTTARTFAIVGAVLGALGLATGVGAMVVAARKR